MRPIAEEEYGIPRAQVVGSSVVSESQVKDGKAEIVRLQKIGFIDDKAGKPLRIYEHIGRRLILACGNSGSDMQMIEAIMCSSSKIWRRAGCPLRRSTRGT